MDNKPSIEQVLINAKSLLVNVGWCKNQMVEYTYGVFDPYDYKPIAYCTTGAIFEASSAYENFYADSCFIFTSAHPLYSNVAQWNDRPWRTKRSVLKAFDKAIKYAHKRDL